MSIEDTNRRLGYNRAILDAAKKLNGLGLIKASKEVLDLFNVEPRP